MDRFECPGSAACRQYCEALLGQGVAVDRDDSGCNVPAMFTGTAKSFRFKPELEDETGDPELIDRLGSALGTVLSEYTRGNPEQAAVAELMTGYNDAFEARLDLWRGMLDGTRSLRRFTDVELSYYQQKITDANNAVGERAATASPEAVLRAQAASDRKSLVENGLLFDDQMVKVVDHLVGNLMDGKPTLLVGDKGIAKTQAAYFAAKLWDAEAEPIIISGHGDMMSNELIGQVEQDPATKIFRFKEGKLVQAMREGRPVILDEVNIGDQQIVMRLQHLLLRRPGDKIMLQENGGKEIEIQPGFAVFATANEASARYQQRNVLDPAFRDRYDVLQLKYPDSNTREPIAKVPASLMRLALAAAVDETGIMSPHIDVAELEKFVRLAHVTQHLYSVPTRNARVAVEILKSDDGGSALIVDDEEPIMTDCITPRALADIIARCAPGNKPDKTLKLEIKRAIAGLDQAGSTHNWTYAKRILRLLDRQ